MPRKISKTTPTIEPAGVTKRTPQRPTSNGARRVDQPVLRLRPKTPGPARSPTRKSFQGTHNGPFSLLSTLASRRDTLGADEEPDLSFKLEHLPSNTVKLRIHGDNNHPTCHTLNPDESTRRDENEDNCGSLSKTRCDACVYFLDDPHSHRVARWSSKNELDDVTRYTVSTNVLSVATDVYIRVDLDMMPPTIDSSHDDATTLAHKALSGLVTALLPHLRNKRVWLHITPPDTQVDGDDEYRRAQFLMFAAIRCDNLIVVQTPPAWEALRARVEAEVISRSTPLDLFSQRVEIMKIPFVGHSAVFQPALDSLFDYALTRDITGFQTIHRGVRATIDHQHPNSEYRIQQEYSHAQTLLRQDYDKTRGMLQDLHESDPDLSPDLYQEASSFLEQQYQERKTLLEEGRRSGRSRREQAYEHDIRQLDEERDRILGLLQHLHESDPDMTHELYHGSQQLLLHEHQARQSLLRQQHQSHYSQLEQEYHFSLRVLLDQEHDLNEAWARRAPRVDESKMEL